LSGSTSSPNTLEDQAERRFRLLAEADVSRLNAELNARLRELRTILDTAPVGINVARDPARNAIVGNPRTNPSAQATFETSLPARATRSIQVVTGGIFNLPA
jgi:hypothetical protein